MAGGCAPTAPGGTCPLDDPTCLTNACGFDGTDCGSCQGGKGPNAGSYCRPEVQLCDMSQTTSMCSNCAAGNDVWGYSPVNGNFTTQAQGDRRNALCVTHNVPNY